MYATRLVSALGIATLIAVAGCKSATDEDTMTEPKLSVLERSATSMKLQWDSFGKTGWFTVDVLTGVPSCQAFPEHPNGTELAATSLELTGLVPSTTYHIHVHALDGPHGNVDGQTKTNNVYVATLAAGSAAVPVSAGDYTTCK